MTRPERVGLASQRTRNLAVIIFLFFGSFVLASMLHTVLDQAWSPMMDMANNSSNTSWSNIGLQRAQDAWNNWVIFILTLIFVLGIGGAAASSRGPFR